jgi:4-amino-4-deoxy-L-arabinose transferase-like glycosyltransferase
VAESVATLWRRTPTFAKRLGLIALAGLAWRVIYITTEPGIVKLTDEYWFIGMARQMFTAHRFTSLFPTASPATAQHGPLTSIIVSPFAWMFPHALEGLRNVMAVIGMGTIVMMGLAGREAGGERVGLIAAGITAALPDFWVRDGLVVSEPVAAFIVACAIFVALRHRRRLTPWAAVTLGALTGLITLARPEIAPVLLVITAVLVIRHSSGRAVLNGLVALAALLAMVAPWSIYNASRFDRPVLLSNNLGITLAGANCPQTYYSWAYIGYDTSICWDAAQARAAKVSPDESVQSAVMRDEGVRYAYHHLSRLPLVAVMRVAWFVGLYRPGWVVGMGWWGDQPRWATWSQAWSFYFVFPISMIVWWLNRRRDWPHWIFGLLVANSFVVVVLFVGHWRYRVTLDVAMTLILALGIGRLFERRTSEAAEPEPALVGAVP